MEESKINTQINEKLGNKISFKNINGYAGMQYGGTVMMIPYADFLQFKDLAEKVMELDKKNKDKDEIIKAYNDKYEKLKSQYSQLLNQAKNMEITYKNSIKVLNEKLLAFTDNQRGGKTKFTAHMKSYVLEMTLKGQSITQAYNQMMNYFNYPDISYETVRRFISEQRPKSGNQ